jgi:hypothetical protein
MAGESHSEKIHVSAHGAIMVKCIPSNARKHRRVRPRGAGRIADVLRGLLAIGIIAFVVVFAGHASHARDRLPGDVQ